VSQSATSIPFRACLPAPIDAQFDLGSLTSDGGLLWLQEADTALGLCAALAGVIPDWRRAHVQHSIEHLIRQRVFQIACGYEDQDDADTLRTDPLLKLVCGRFPDQRDLASQPTMSRLENHITRRTCYDLAHTLVELYLRERERAGTPRHLLLDLDGTDDPVHGSQEGARYHGYFREHMYHPLLLFDGDTDQLITAMLRPGNAHASRGVVAVLRRLVPLLRARWPGVTIELRADSGFASPALYAFCEEQGLTYTIGLIPNPRLEARAAPLLEEAQRLQQETDEKVRLADELRYAADSWPHPRRVVYKAEALPKGPNTRFVVTTREDPPLALYNWYVRRGEPEQWIKDFKRACFADRLSDHRFFANQFRLLLHAAAYWLLDTLRRWLVQLGIPRMQLDTLRLRLIKIAGWIRRRLDGIRLHLASSHPGHVLWRALADRPNRLVNNSG
jgi:hypothetical protein